MSISTLKKKYPDDVRAYEFGFTTPGGFLSGPQRAKIDKQIAHPTEVPTDAQEKVHFTYILAHQALVCVFQFIDFILAGPHPPSTPYGRSIAFTKNQYLAYWAAYTGLVPVDERLPIPSWRHWILHLASSRFAEPRRRFNRLL
jgi:hypothetical protein